MIFPSTSLTICFILLFLCGQAQPYLLRPEGFSREGITTYCLEGKSEPYLKYKDPPLSITVPADLPFQKAVPYRDLLKSGLKSMLLEYKNYSGSILSSYWIFALGNYNMLSESTLSVMNQWFFPNQPLLRKIYGWLQPYYLKVFEAMTVEEQQALARQLSSCEKYIQFVWKRRNEIGYRQWLNEQMLEEDTKLTGFLARRINKKQWSVSDCEYWIDRLKQDFLTHLKDEKLAASHYQLIERLNSNLVIAVDHVGHYFILNSGYQPLTEPFVWIRRSANGELDAYRSTESADRVTLKLVDGDKLVVIIPDIPDEYYNGGVENR